MNKRNKTITLSVLVIGIWGLIGYNIYSYLNPEIEKITVTQFKNEKTLVPHDQKEKLVISNYRDPFLGKIIVDKKKSNTATNTLINFPLISYHGSITGNRKKSYIISVQNQQELLKIGQSFLDVKLISATKNQIIIIYKSARKTIKLQQ